MFQRHVLCTGRTGLVRGLWRIKVQRELCLSVLSFSEEVLLLARLQVMQRMVLDKGHAIELGDRTVPLLMACVTVSFVALKKSQIFTNKSHFLTSDSPCFMWATHFMRLGSSFGNIIHWHRKNNSWRNCYDFIAAASNAGLTSGRITWTLHIMWS